MNKEFFDHLSDLKKELQKELEKVTRKIYRDKESVRKRIQTLDNIRQAKRKSSKLKATPKWSELDKIKIVYEKAKWLEEITGIKYHVDHIIPLQGKNVCGLHVWQNLQILEDKLNISKSNKH